MTETTGRRPLAYHAYRAATWVVWCVAWPLLRVARARSGEWRERLAAAPPGAPGAVWVHAASVGEVGAAAPFIRELAGRGHAVRVTVVTPTGVLAARRSLPDAVPVEFAPLDFVPTVRSALASRRPSLVVLIETELWPNLLVEAAALGVPVAMANARLSERSLARYRSKASPLRGVSRLIRAAVCQSQDDVRRFVRLGFDRSVVRSFGTTKFDALDGPLAADERESLRASYGFAPGRPLLVFGSVRPREEGDVVRAIRDCVAALPDVAVVIAPRHLERVGPLEAALEAEGLATVRRTELRVDASTASAGGDAASGDADTAPVVILDTTGELGRAYALGSAAFVGGTLADYGGHNPLEPAAQGVPVVLGPYTETCRESAALLLDAKAAVTVSDGDELTAELLRIVSDEEVRQAMSAACTRVTSEGRGASARAVEWLTELGLLPGGSSGEGASA